MALAVVNYPTVSDADYEWIQSVRKEHDRLYYDVIDPHISLVFPIEDIETSTLVDHVRDCARSHSSFEVVFRCAVLGDPDFEGHAHAFLVPDEGFSDVVRLHDRLYSGVLAEFFRLDIPFLPHLGIANTPKPRDCKAIVDELNDQRFEIRGRVEGLDVIAYDGESVQPVRHVTL